MSIEALTNEPLEIYAGERWWWKRSFTDYPASAGWVLTYYFVHPTITKVTIAASADTDDYEVDVAPATTAAYTAGDYNWVAFIEKSLEKYKVDEGTLTILADISAAGVTTLDDRSHAVKTLAYIETAIEGNATKDIQSYSIEGRSISRYSKDELMALHKRYKRLVNLEKKKERTRNGLDAGNKVKARFL